MRIGQGSDSREQGSSRPKQTFRSFVPTGAGALGFFASVGLAIGAGRPPLLVIWIGLFGAALGVLVASDLRERRLPNSVTYAGTAGSLVVAAAVGLEPFLAALLGGVLGGGLALAAWWLARGQLGLGDVKMSVFVGSFLGPSAIVPYFVLGTGAGALIGLSMLARGRSRESTFAYGPALAAGSIFALSLGSVQTVVG